MARVKELEAAWNTPGATLRGAPFWAWNGKLDPEELRRQVRLFKRMGIGGFFMHARVGLGTAYLSEDWFRCVKAVQDEAKKQGLLANLYDEDRWPSGAAGGLVTKNPAFRQRVLSVTEVPAGRQAGFTPAGEVLAVFAGRLENERTVSGLRRLDTIGDALRDGETLLVFDWRTADLRPWYNGETYLDTMNPEAVAEFIRVTHETYAKEVGDTFGNVSPSIFTDEPNFGTVGRLTDDRNGLPRTFTPWTGAIPAEYRKRFGGDIRDVLPQIFFDVTGVDCVPARMRYMEIITSLFVSSFTKQIGDWCGRHGIAFTGHMLEEDKPSSQTRNVGSAMRHYEYMQQPGIDLLTEHWRIYDTAKQTVSMARQFGRTRRLSETYGCTGWDFPFAGHKALGDWQLALGINLRCQHLSFYTMAAEAKRDYPAAIFYQSPWAGAYPKVEDYFARANAVMTQGCERRDILVIHPVESMWTLIGKEYPSRPEAKALDSSLIALRDSLLTRQLDFDYGDEEVMSRHAKIDGKTIRIGEAAYRVAVVPAMRTMRRTTLELLKQFAAAGGKIVFAHPAPERLDGVLSGEPAAFAAPFRSSDAAAACESARLVRVRTSPNRPPAAILTNLHEADGFDALFLCNTGHRPEQLVPDMNDMTMVRDRTQAFPAATVEFVSDKAGACLEFDPATGKIFPTDSHYENGKWVVNTSFAPLASRLFVAFSAVPALPVCAVPPPFAPGGNVPLGRSWKIVLPDPNAVVFDHFAAAVDGGEFGAPEYMLALDSRLRDRLGLPCRGGQMLQPWVQSREQGKTLCLRLRAEFEIAELPASSVKLAIEFPELWQIAVNGVPVAADDVSGWYIDRSLKTLPVPAEALRTGRNTVELSTGFNGTHPGLEEVFLLGDFGTRMKKEQLTELLPPVRTLEIGDWTEQGLTNYAGNVAYRQIVRNPSPGRRMRLSLGEWRGTAVRVTVDGREAGFLGWPPYELVLNDTPAEFELGIEVLGHRRNALGPFYCGETWPFWTGPGQYVDYVGASRALVPCGLLFAPKLEIEA